MRAFLAYPIPEIVQEEIARLFYGLPNTSWIKSCNLHITLQFYPNLSEDLIPNIHNKLDRNHFLTIFTKAKGLGKFLYPKGNAVVWLGLENSIQIIQERNKILSSLKEMNLEYDKKFQPHITIGRSKQLSTNRWLSYFENFQFFESSKFSLDSIVLYKSTLNPKGSIYEEIFKICLD